LALKGGRVLLLYAKNIPLMMFVLIFISIATPGNLAEALRIIVEIISQKYIEKVGALTRDWTHVELDPSVCTTEG
jgi:hypothetical protein